WLTGRPNSVTCRTASSLNSSEKTRRTLLMDHLRTSKIEGVEVSVKSRPLQVVTMAPAHDVPEIAIPVVEPHSTGSGISHSDAMCPLSDSGAMRRSREGIGPFAAEE